ncbi:uncharacterized protein I303_100710 [Kwoniella dejecticola CBS 10117]|uniref:Uncharacterized protein n=1 Tax=Kwoniella dejecticola CBS 10117 TaxID=1296121 RepID=A0A1A6AFQ1_9TREE|nr:uncharacterized protein I303_00713 [Kwoniella dejecticola CBS 10117]OBR88895.1 hypothetical protein I303_00713 [Kwoniella dejecticola CBS 10117]
MAHFAEHQITLILGSENQPDIFIGPILPSCTDKVIKLGGKILGHDYHACDPLSETFGSDQEEDGLFAMFTDESGDKLRRRVRDKYGNGRWGQFFRLAEIAPQGGSMSLDDKLFIFPSSTNDDILRFDNGVCVEEFTDLRANPRCLLESQFFHWRELFLSLVPDAQDRIQIWIDRIFILGEIAAEPIISTILAQLFDLPVYTASIPPISQTGQDLNLYIKTGSAWADEIQDRISNTCSIPCSSLVTPRTSPSPSHTSTSILHSPHLQPLSKALRTLCMTPIDPGEKWHEQQEERDDRVDEVYIHIMKSKADNADTNKKNSHLLNEESTSSSHGIDYAGGPLDSPAFAHGLSQRSTDPMRYSHTSGKLTIPPDDKFPHLMYASMMCEYRRLKRLVDKDLYIKPSYQYQEQH